MKEIKIYLIVFVLMDIKIHFNCSGIYKEKSICHAM